MSGCREKGERRRRTKKGKTEEEEEERGTLFLSLSFLMNPARGAERAGRGRVPTYHTCLGMLDLLTTDKHF